MCSINFFFYYLFRDLSKNRILFIEHGVFISTPELKQIDLSNNLLSTLKQSLFDHLVLLKQM